MIARAAVGGVSIRPPSTGVKSGGKFGERNRADGENMLIHLFVNRFSFRSGMPACIDRLRLFGEALGIPLTRLRLFRLDESHPDQVLDA